jgi:chromate reductase, NAD(P)H dehydrogenase (quinone)
MSQRKKVLAISGSTRQHSSNHNLINAIAELFAGEIEVTVFDSIAGLPHFDPDNTIDNVPSPVLNFRKQINDADGVLICTPEYAHGVPGSLKNAIDWTVSSNEFSHKPVVLITASTDGKFGHAALLETLKVIEAENIDQLQLLIPFIRTKISGDKITDEKTLAEIKLLINNFITTIANTR